MSNSPTISRITIYPIKSFDGISLEQSIVTEGGCLLHDREFALFDSNGKKVNGKNNAMVHRLRSTFDLENKMVSFRMQDEQDCQQFNLQDRDAIEIYLSEYFGFKINFLQDKTGRFLDIPDVSGATVVATSTLQTVSHWYDEMDLEETRRRFRATIEIEGVEEFWEDHLFSEKGTAIEFKIGDVRMMGMAPRARCIVPTRDPDTAEPIHAFAKTFARHRAETLPPWSTLDSYGHHYYLTADCHFPDSEVGKCIRLGDSLEIAGPRIINSQTDRMDPFGTVQPYTPNTNFYFMPAIGNTPLIKLSRITSAGTADIYVKYEGANPTGSMKDRMAQSMIEGAERRGELKPGGRVMDYTGGSTGSSLAMVCATKGYQAHFVSSDCFAEEKLQTMRAFGATLEIFPSDGGKITAKLIDDMVQRARELSKEENTFWTDQFNNIDNRNAYHKMAREVIDVLGTEIDEFIMGVGTGGCFSGNSEVFKKEIPAIRCIALEPLHVRALSGGELTGTHRLEGIGAGFVPSICRLDLADEIIGVSDEDAVDMARKLARLEGIFGGTTSGGNVWAALQRAKVLGPGKKIVTVVCDSGLKYLHGDLYK